MHRSEEDEARDDIERAIQRQGGRRAPQRIAEAVSQLLARRGYAHIQSSGEFAAVWREVVGERLRDDCRPGKLHRGVLEILVRHAAAAQELTMQKRMLLKDLNNLIENTTIRGLRFRVIDWKIGS
jgi:hypothetical protein